MDKLFSSPPNSASIGLKIRARAQISNRAVSAARFRFTEEAMNEFIHHVSDATFEPEVLKSDVPVLVDYWAEWCGPCKAIAPVLDEVAKESSVKLKVAKVTVDENPHIPNNYGTRGIP